MHADEGVEEDVVAFELAGDGGAEGGVGGPEGGVVDGGDDPGAEGGLAGDVEFVGALKPGGGSAGVEGVDADAEAEVVGFGDGEAIGDVGEVVVLGGGFETVPGGGDFDAGDAYGLEVGGPFGESGEVGAGGGPVPHV